MIGLTWITALVLAIPSYGISIIIAIIVSMYITRQNNLAAAQVAIVTAVGLQINIINKYNNLRMRERCRPTILSDSNIYEHVIIMTKYIEAALKAGGRFHENQEDIINLAVRYISYKEDFIGDRETYQAIIEENLELISQKGVNAVLQTPYHCELDYLESDY